MKEKKQKNKTILECIEDLNYKLKIFLSEGLKPIIIFLYKILKKYN